jgi:integrase
MLTDKVVKELRPLPDRKQWIKADHDRGGDGRPPDDPNQTCRGFGVKIMQSGTKTYVVSYRINGKETEFVIGPCSSWRCIDARKKAREVRKQASEGKSPQATRVAAREAETVKELAERYLEEHASKKRPRGKYEDESLINQWVLPELGSLKVAEVEFSHVDRLHRKITRGGNGRKATPVRANRCLTLLSKMFNLSIHWKMRGDNPVKGVGRNHEDPRERYLDDEEIERLTKALAEHPEREAVNAISLLLYTGARPGETKQATWRQFNLEKGTWAKPSLHTRQEKIHHVQLAPDARDFLIALRDEAEREVAEYNAKRKIGQPKREPSPFLFPGRGTDGPITDIKNSWKAIRDAAELKPTVLDDGRVQQVRMYDLRHSVASILANKGVSLQIIGTVLGHTQPETTKRYAHIADKTQREAAELVSQVVKLKPRKGA